MSVLDNIFDDVKQAEEQAPVIPPGDYNGIVQGWQIDTVETQEGEREVLRLVITLQENPGVYLSGTSSLVDGQNVEYSIFLPNEADKNVPARFGRGSLYDISIRKLKRLFKVCGVNPEDHNSFEEALDACRDSRVIVSISNYTAEDGTVYDKVSKIS